MPAQILRSPDRLGQFQEIRLHSSYPPSQLFILCPLRHVRPFLQQSKPEQGTHCSRKLWEVRSPFAEPKFKTTVWAHSHRRRAASCALDGIDSHHFVREWGLAEILLRIYLLSTFLEPPSDYFHETFPKHVCSRKPQAPEVLAASVHRGQACR